MLSNGNRQLIPANYPSPRIIPYDNNEKHSNSKLKQYKSAERGEIKEPIRQVLNEKKEGYMMGQLKTVQIEERQSYREPRISTKKVENQYPHGQMHSPR